MLIFQGVPTKTSNNATGPWGPLKEIHIAHSIALEVGRKTTCETGLCRVFVGPPQWDPQGNLYKFGGGLTDFFYFYPEP